MATKKTTIKSTPLPEAKPAAVKSAKKPVSAAKPPAKAAAPVKAPAPVAPAAPIQESVLAPAKKAAASKTPPAKPAAPVKPSEAAKPASKKAAPKDPGYSQEDVALRAYFIAEKRRAHHLPGDEAHDWIEAERQLAAEFSGGKKAKKR